MFCSYKTNVIRNMKFENKIKTFFVIFHITFRVEIIMSEGLNIGVNGCTLFWRQPNQNLRSDGKNEHEKI